VYNRYRLWLLQLMHYTCYITQINSTVTISWLRTVYFYVFLHVPNIISCAKKDFKQMSIVHFHSYNVPSISAISCNNWVLFPVISWNGWTFQPFHKRPSWYCHFVKVLKILVLLQKDWHFKPFCEITIFLKLLKCTVI